MRDALCGDPAIARRGAESSHGLIEGRDTGRVPSSFAQFKVRSTCPSLGTRHFGRRT